MTDQIADMVAAVQGRPHRAAELSDAEIDRIARRIVEMLKESEHDDYTDGGPDPQSVDKAWLASITKDVGAGAEGTSERAQSPAPTLNPASGLEAKAPLPSICPTCSNWWPRCPDPFHRLEGNTDWESLSEHGV